MSEVITGGYEEQCDVAGGVDKHYDFPTRANGATTIDTYEVDLLTGTVTDLTLIAGYKSFPFTVEAETGSFTADSAGEKTAGSISYAHSSVCVFHGNTGDNLVNIHAMNVGRHAVIHALADGTYELLHMTNGAKNQSARASGTAYTDMNGTTLTLTSNEKLYAPKIPVALVEALLIPAS